MKIPGGAEAMQLRIAEAYIKQFGELAKNGTSMIVPANVADISSMIATAMNVMKVPGLEPRLSAREQPRATT